MHTFRRNWTTIVFVFGVGVIVVVAALKALADAPQPILVIVPSGTNQFQIRITNGTNTANYQLYWTPALNNISYPWAVLSVGSQGQTNFTVNGGMSASGFFKVAVGTDWDGDGVVNWQDANATDPAIGILNVIIDSPSNGATLN